MKWYLKHYDQLTHNELYDILKQRIDVFVVEQNCPYPECDGKDKNSYHMWAVDEKPVIAYIRILPPGISYREASIGRVLVNKEYRKRGLGYKLMNRGITFIEETLNENKIRISAQQHLYDFYNNLGFEKVSDMYLEDGIPHIEMLYTSSNK